MMVMNDECPKAIARKPKVESERERLLSADHQLLTATGSSQLSELKVPVPVRAVGGFPKPAKVPAKGR